MKRLTIILAGAALLFAATGCSKEKTCRCAVRGTSKVRIIKIQRGECSQLSHIYYHDELQNQLIDSLVCTDYEFKIDSIYNNEEQ